MRQEGPEGLQAQRAGGHPEHPGDDGDEVDGLAQHGHGEVQLAVVLLLPDQRGHRLPARGCYSHWPLVTNGIRVGANLLRLCALLG